MTRSDGIVTRSDGIVTRSASRIKLRASDAQVFFLFACSAMSSHVACGKSKWTDYRFTGFPKPDVGERCNLCPIATKKNAMLQFLKLIMTLTSLLSLTLLRLEPYIIKA